MSDGGGPSAHERVAEGSTKRGRLVAFALPFLLLGLLEGVLRLGGYGYLPAAGIVIWNAKEDADLLTENALHRIDPHTLWAPRPGARVPWGERERVSPQGFRGADPNPDARTRVLVLGDSSTFGYGVGFEATYGAALERGLADCAPAPIQVLNGGLIGSTIVQGLERYRLIRSTWRPDVVVLAFGAVNEHWATSGLDDRAKLAELAAMRASGEERRRGFVRWAREELRCVHLAAHLRDLGRGGRVRLLKQQASKSAADAKTGRYLEPGYHRRVTPQVFAECLEAFLLETSVDGTRLVAVHMPRPAPTEAERPAVLDYDPRLQAFAQERGVPLAAAHADFRASGLTDEELFVDPYHPSELGHERIAGLLLPLVCPP